jgi:hypothetical protein
MKHGARLSAQKIKSMDEHVHDMNLLYRMLELQTPCDQEPVRSHPNGNTTEAVVHFASLS